MKKHVLAFALIGTLMIAPSFANAQAMAPNMDGMAGMAHDTKSADAQGVGVVKAIDTTQGTITLQHGAIASIGWPAMTMPFKVASADLLKVARVGDKVQFTLRPAGKDTMLTSVTLLQP
ncbi:copper-binding protein (plasmid) [Dyella sp. BiH032]|uniref:copper-binding protein n=1 Tax=Dyella sp. BiH032 TaxID=3075430 RepID=UPI00289319D4|nr:copper-binding protein [Dyella sp. BiH032]WNL48508.1 copper-binding protein [Dyella sp. BiH032]